MKFPISIRPLIFTALIAVLVPAELAAQDAFSSATATDSAETTDSAASVQTEKFSLQELLAAYLANHREIQNLTIQLEQRELSHQSTKISQGVNLELSTGTFSIGSSQVRGEPSISVTMPKLNNSFVEARVPLQFATGSSNSTQNAAGGVSGIQEASVTLGTEILGGSGKSARLAVLRAERSLLEARRAVQSQALAVEQEFYSKIRELYSSYASLLSARSSVYTKELDLETLRVQGYRADSPRYRTAQLSVLSEQRTADKQQRTLERELELFAQKCGLAAGQLSMEQFSPAAEVLAATGILERLPIAGIEKYSAMEAAQWNLATTELEMDADSAVTLTAEAGYTHRRNGTDSSPSQDTVNAAVGLQALGGRLTSGVEIPVTGETKTPSATLSLSWSPNTMKTQSLQRQQNQLNLELTRLKIQEAEESYRDTVENLTLTWEELIWSREVALEELELYQQLAADTTNLYNQGLTSETEYRQALTNRDRAQIQCQIADLELILHSVSARELFIGEEN